MGDTKNQFLFFRWRTFQSLDVRLAYFYQQYEVACCAVQSVLNKRNYDRQTTVVTDFDAYDRETDNLVEAARDKHSLQSFGKDYAKAQAEVIKKVLMPDPSMLEKRLLIIPTCSGNHWTAVFLFNPSFIKLAQT